MLVELKYNQKQWGVVMDKTINYMALGDRIRIARKSKRLSQEKLGEITSILILFISLIIELLLFIELPQPPKNKTLCVKDFDLVLCVNNLKNLGIKPKIKVFSIRVFNFSKGWDLKYSAFAEIIISTTSIPDGQYLEQAPHFRHKSK